MIIPDKKKAVSVILARMNPGGKEKQQEVKSEAPMNDDDAALESIAQDIMQAIKDGSAQDLVMALKAFDAECERSEDGDGGENPEEQE